MQRIKVVCAINAFSTVATAAATTIARLHAGFRRQHNTINHHSMTSHCVLTRRVCICHVSAGSSPC